MTLISKEPINTVSEHLRRLLHFLRGLMARLFGPNRGTRMGIQGWSAWGGPSGGVWTPQAPVLDTSAFSFRPTLKAPDVNRKD